MGVHEHLFDRKDVIVTHDSGSPRNQLVPFYQAPTPRSYLGWGKSHALGTGLGLIMGAKLAAPEKFCVNFMGDAAFGMTGLDFETAVRNDIPTLTIVLNNNFMAAETHSMQASHERYGTMNILGNYADLAKSLGGWSESASKSPARSCPLCSGREKSPTMAKPRYWNLLRVENTPTRELDGRRTALLFASSQQIAKAHTHE